MKQWVRGVRETVVVILAAIAIGAALVVWLVARGRTRVVAGRRI